MRMYRLRDDLFINIEAITLIIDRGFGKDGHRVRIYTFDGEHNYILNNEDWTRLQCLIEREVKNGKRMG